QCTDDPFDEHLVGWTRCIGGFPSRKPPKGETDADAQTAFGTGEEVGGLAGGARSGGESFANGFAFFSFHLLVLENRDCSFLRARCIRTRTPVTVMSKRRAISLSASPSTSRASRISRSSGERAASA